MYITFRFVPSSCSSSFLNSDSAVSFLSASGLTRLTAFAGLKVNFSLTAVFEEDFFYFVNSYYVKPGQKGIIAAVTDYYGEFACAIQDKNVTAVQFHPEKSGSSGIALLQRWLDAY